VKGGPIKNITIKTLIIVFLLSGCLISAERILAQAGPLDAEAYYKLENAHAEAGRWQEAIEAYKQTIRLKSDDAAAHAGLGVCLFEDRG